MRLMQAQIQSYPRLELAVAFPAISTLPCIRTTVVTEAPVLQIYDKLDGEGDEKHDGTVHEQAGYTCEQQKEYGHAHGRGAASAQAAHNWGLGIAGYK